jgi:hypothetical protein
LSTVCLSMYSITENIYYSQLSSVAILLQPEPVSHRIIQGNDCVFSPSVLSSFGLHLSPTCLLLTVTEARSYFASTINRHRDTDTMPLQNLKVRVFTFGQCYDPLYSTRVKTSISSFSKTHFITTSMSKYF